MMAEWWNLDQVLLWMVTRDAETVRDAEGDPDGRRPRHATYFGWAALGEIEGEEPPPEPQPREQGAMAVLMAHLGTGRFEARAARQETTALLIESNFKSFECAPTTPEGAMILRTLNWPYETLSILISAESVMREFPPRAPDDMQNKLTELLDATSPDVSLQLPTRKAQRVRKAKRVKEWLDINQPDGLPDPDKAPGERAKLYDRIVEDLTAQFHVPFSRSTVEKAALEWAEFPSGKTERQI